MKIRVRGLVHGVYYRASLAKVAGDEKVTGWVRNLPDGSVEALLEGEEDSVERVLDWSRHGPPDARVDSVQVAKVELGKLRGFRITG